MLSERSEMKVSVLFSFERRLQLACRLFLLLDAVQLAVRLGKAGEDVEVTGHRGVDGAGYVPDFLVQFLDVHVVRSGHCFVQVHKVLVEQLVYLRDERRHFRLGLARFLLEVIGLRGQLRGQRCLFLFQSFFERFAGECRVQADLSVGREGDAAVGAAKTIRRKDIISLLFASDDDIPGLRDNL